MRALVLSTVVIFIAELGDKSQLIAMTLASRFRAWKVLAGVTVATAAVHLISVGIGAALGDVLPMRAIWMLSGLSFLGFAAWTLIGDRVDDEEPGVVRTGWAVIPAIAAAFFLSELGDKTMFATIALATTEGWLGVWVGSTIGMVAADALAILVGMALGRNLPQRAVRYGAAAFLAAFGVIAISQALLA